MADILPKLFLQGDSVPDWEGGACTDPRLDPETWFLDDPIIANIAKGYCALCPFGPVKGDDSCYEYFLKVEEETGYFAYGIVGGRSAYRRQRILDIRKLEKEAESGDESSGQGDQEGD